MVEEKELGEEKDLGEAEQVTDAEEGDEKGEDGDEGEEDPPCCVCFNNEAAESDDVMVFCSRCDLAVHQLCYGKPTFPQIVSNR